MKKFLLYLSAMGVIFPACSTDENSENEENIIITPLPAIENISLNCHNSEQTVKLSRNVEEEGATISLKDDSYWISKLKLNGDEVTFTALENPEIEKGHRYDTIIIDIKGQRIGTICVSQARKPESPERLVWAVSNAMYRHSALCESGLSGQEITKAIYNLEKITNGQDSYKNYPAFAYCIEMNHDPENNMEWHLPSLDEMRAYAQAQSYINTPLGKHNYWWSATENSLNGNAYNLYSESTASRGAVDKGGDWWVMAFRNGKMEE